MTPQQERNAKFEAVFTAGEINTRRIKCLGSFVHIDTFEKYEDKINQVMGALGAKLLMAENGRHMDGVDGFRLVYKF
jgi:hypothetical protein